MIKNYKSFPSLRLQFFKNRQHFEEFLVKGKLSNILKIVCLCPKTFSKVLLNIVLVLKRNQKNEEFDYLLNFKSATSKIPLTLLLV